MSAVRWNGELQWFSLVALLRLSASEYLAYWWQVAFETELDRLALALEDGPLGGSVGAGVAAAPPAATEPARPPLEASSGRGEARARRGG